MVASTVELSLGTWLYVWDVIFWLKYATAVLTNMVDLYIGSEHDTAIRTLVKSTDLKTQLDGYAYEALSMFPLGCFLGANLMSLAF